MKIQSKYKENTIQIQSKRHQNKPYSKSDLVLKRKNTRGIRGNTRLKQETTRKNNKISQGTCCKTRGPGRIPRKYDENTRKYEENTRKRRGNARKCKEIRGKYEREASQPSQERPLEASRTHAKQNDAFLEGKI